MGERQAAGCGPDEDCQVRGVDCTPACMCDATATSTLLIFDIWYSIGVPAD